MREERRQISGDQVISEGVELWGTVAGKVHVVDGGKLYVRGSIYGDLIVHNGGRCHALGNISGSVTVKKGAKVILSGVVGGEAVNEGGRLFVEATAKISGKVRTKEGKTTVDPHAQVKE